MIELPADDRRQIEQYLGKDFLGAAVAAPPIGDVMPFLGLAGDDTTWVNRIVSEPGKGTTRELVFHRLEREGAAASYHVQFGENAWYAGLDEQGRMNTTATVTAKQGVISRYTPPEPFLRPGMKPGESVRTRIAVDVDDLSNPSRVEHTGTLDLTYSYVGAYTVTVPAGTYDAVLLKWHYEGSVGPASVRDDQYWFFAPGVGPVARIDKQAISAFLFYNDDTRTAGVLVERR